MDGQHKHPRQYRSPLRQQQARETRERVLQAARDLFIERGYERATVKAIAERAHVSPETIYSVFGNKRSLLERLLHVAVTGADAAAPVMEGPGPAAVHTARNQREMLQRFAHDITWRVARAGPLMEVLVAAARSEHEMAEVHELLQAGRLYNLRTMVGWLAELGPLRVTVDRAADTVWALTSAEMYGSLVRGRGWSAEEYEGWLADALTAVLLRATPQQ